ncbi:hypothetical protein ANME2D_02321 [Candidatus Methanoperedens nitroreducens]|uniref:Phage virion morphogenesis protein n=1 Tax=Candidatus Methanoperedens nitratireducens TaxID=1392998 RepID=A0A062UX66_9EURY|nr:hypothetical protein [Candidatus Methanoperedens nitroreducens]KCZ71586.1 hypothetical protein ANME2D_02321 [Candidatus Methanoperedens nitroreducens]MDJ1421215.1 hypothetical protein [Candidatus Methanoperedens sp.]
MLLKIEVEGFEVAKDIAGFHERLDTNVRHALEKSAMFLERKTKDAITRGIPPPLKQATIRRKGSSTPLIDTGLMRSQIAADYGHLKSNVALVGVFGNRSRIAAYHEFGTRTIPQRSFLRSTVEDPLTENALTGYFLKAVEDSINDKHKV